MSADMAQCPLDVEPTKAETHWDTMATLQLSGPTLKVTQAVRVKLETGSSEVSLSDINVPYGGLSSHHEPDICALLSSSRAFSSPSWFCCYRVLGTISHFICCSGCCPWIPEEMRDKRVLQKTGNTPWASPARGHPTAFCFSAFLASSCVPSKHQ